MNMQKNLKQLIFSLVMLTSSFSMVAGESFRVSKVHIVEVSQKPNTENTEQLGINDSLCIKLPENNEFLEGLEFKFTIPESVAYWMDSVACSIYVDIKPTPEGSQIDYSGSKVFQRTLPNKLSWVLQIPLTENHTLKSNNCTQTIDTILTPSNNIIFLRLQPVMKGVPEETLNAIIPITIRPILINKGKLKLTLLPPTNEEELQNTSIFIDDEMVSLNEKDEILLETGVHNISIVSEAYRNEMRTVRIEQGSQTDLNVTLKSINPTLLITAPEGTIVTLDDLECDKLGQEFEITEGQHKIKFAIGNYEMVRTIDAIKGKTYKADFTLDLNITEE